jgi:phosphoheptose isomerase
MLEIAQAELDSYLLTARACADLGPAIAEAGSLIAKAAHDNRKILIIGNGGSAAAAQHIAAELAGRRKGWPLSAMSLTSDTSVLTAIANDFGYSRIFEIQIRAFGREGDVVLALSTSGASMNTLLGAAAARECGCTVVALVGAEGGALADLADVVVRAPSTETARIQEVHVAIGHIICRIVDEWPSQRSATK